MWTMMIVSMLVLLLIGSAGLAFAFGSADEHHQQQEPLQDPASQPRPLVFFQPTGWSANGKRLEVDQIVRQIEGHLRDERSAATPYVEEPSADRLHLD